MLEICIKLIYIAVFTIFVVYSLIVRGSKDGKQKTKKFRAKKFFQDNLQQHENERKRYNDRFNLLVFLERLKPYLITGAIVLGFGILVPLFTHKREIPTIIEQQPRQSEIVPPTQQRPVKDVKEKVAWTTGEEKIYSRIDRKGKKFFTNVKTAADPESRETPITIQSNNAILIPVKFVQNGMTISTQMLLDTGCTGTLVHLPIVQQLKPALIGNSKMTVADGRAIDANMIKFDFLEVGPFKEKNFIASTNYVQNAEQLEYQGLLGMAFLKKHPFQIDTRKNVIRWL